MQTKLSSVQHQETNTLQALENLLHYLRILVNMLGHLPLSERSKPLKVKISKISTYFLLLLLFRQESEYCLLFVISVKSGCKLCYFLRLSFSLWLPFFHSVLTMLHSNFTSSLNYLVNFFSSNHY